MKALFAALLLIAIPAVAEDQAIVVLPMGKNGDLIGFYIAIKEPIVFKPGIKVITFDRQACSQGDA